MFHRSCLRPLLFVLLAVGMALGTTADAFGQRAAKYGADFLAGGVGARALGMGGAHVALAEDATAGYWNPSGLSGLVFPEVAYMHAERFAGTVSYDYGSIAFPINARSTVGLSMIRLGVDDIPNTLNAWDRERDRPLPDAEARVSRFSYAHYAWYLSYARVLNDRLRLGVNGKLLRGNIGEFASSWGYSFDVGVQYRAGRVMLGANLKDATRMLQSWSINEGAYDGADLSYADFSLPEGGAEYVLPVLSLGSGLDLPVGEGSHLIVGADVDLAFDGQRAYALNAGDISFHPRVGTEFNYRGVVALRAGLSEVATDGSSLDVVPAIGAGLHLGQIRVDYGFGDFAGFASDLGYSHRISLQWTLNREGLRRSDR